MSNTQWQFASAAARFRVETDTINGRSTKVITCKAAGGGGAFDPALYLKREVLQCVRRSLAFGEWDFWIYHVGAGTLGIGLFSDIVALAGRNGYAFEQWSAVAWQLHKWTAGVDAFPAWGAGGMTSPEWQHIRISRTVAGVWSVYRNDALLSTAGGAGTNPFTDAAHLTGSYIVLSMGIGDKIALSAIDGSAAFTKRLKG